MVKAKRFVYAKRFDGEPKPDDFKLEEEDLPELQDGGMLIGRKLDTSWLVFVI